MKLIIALAVAKQQVSKSYIHTRLSAYGIYRVANGNFMTGRRDDVCYLSAAQHWTFDEFIKCFGRPGDPGYDSSRKEKE